MVDEQIALSTLSVELDIIIRRATAEDIPLLEWGGEFWRLRERFENAYHEQQIGRRCFLVADLNRYPVARLIVQFMRGNPLFANGDTRGYLYSLQVMEPLRGLGIGTRLIRAAEEVLVEKDITWATIAVAKDNPDARRLYERLGYHVYRDDPGRWHYTDPSGKEHEVNEPSWVMRKRLLPSKPE